MVKSASYPEKSALDSLADKSQKEINYLNIGFFSLIQQYYYVFTSPLLFLSCQLPLIMLA